LVYLPVAADAGRQPAGKPELGGGIIQHAEVLKVNQWGADPRQVYRNDSSMVWVSDVAGDVMGGAGDAAGGDAAGAADVVEGQGGRPGRKHSLYVGLFNTGEREHDVVVDLAALGWKGKVRVRDLWKKEDVGVVKKFYRRRIPAHGATLVQIFP
jgi:alpha-galactosidase